MVNDSWNGHLICLDLFPDGNYKYITVFTVLDREQVLDLAQQYSKHISNTHTRGEIDKLLETTDGQLDDMFVQYVREHGTIDIMTPHQYRRLEALTADDITYILETLRRKAMEKYNVSL